MELQATMSLCDAFIAGGPKRLYIGGEWLEPRSGQYISSINPSTGRAILDFAAADAEDVDLAVAAARNAFEGAWGAFTPVQRQNVMLKLADLIDANFEELHLLDVLDMGAPVGPDPAATAGFVTEVLRYFAGWATKINGETVANSQGAVFSYTLKEPVGVVASIMPWNGPLAGIAWKLAPVLATGCTVVLKPSEESSLSAIRLAELIQEHLDIPAGVINIVTGYGKTAGAALAAHLDVDKVSFTGSTMTGREIVRGALGNLKRVSLELGGKSPNIVFQDADLNLAVPYSTMGMFANSGQSCCAGTRVFVERAIYDEFLERFTASANALKVGNSVDPTTEIGPVVSQRQLDRVTGYIEKGTSEGAKALSGGVRSTAPGLADGYFLAPTVFADVTDDMTIAREEIFGPVACVFPFEDIDEVLRRANSTDFGLASGVWSRDVGKVHLVAKALRAGTVWVNSYYHFDPAMPFGGYKNSGWGKELGVQGIDEYLNVKSVWIPMD